MTCPYIYAAGGLRVASGSARVTVSIDGAERELRVVRDGKGRSRLERGEISLSDLEEMYPEQESFDVLVEHNGVDLRLSLDPKNAMGRRGRGSVEDLRAAIEKLDPVSRKVLAELQIETLPYGLENPEESLERIKWALYQADHLRVSDDALQRASVFMDKEAADMLLERHPDLASRLALQAASGVRPDLMVSMSHALRDTLSESGYLNEAGSVPFLRDWNLSNWDLEDLALAGAVLDERYGALVREVPLSVWSIMRKGGLRSFQDLLASSSDLESSVMRDVDGREMTLSGAAWDTQDGKVVFGAHPDSVWPDGVTLSNRNPYEISGLSPDSPEGREVAIAYSAAIAAVSAANQRCLESTAGRCGSDGKCVECFTDTSQLLRDKSREVTGLKAGRFDPDTTVVDALLYRASRGDAQAAADFRALSDLGERMIDVARQPDRRYGITPRMIEEYKSLRYTAYTIEEPMRLNALSTWRAEQLGRVEEAVSRGEVTPEWAATLRDGIVTWSNDIGFGNKYRDVVTRVIHNAHETFDSRSGGIKTTDLGLDDMYLIHETSYAPQRDADGNVLLRPTGDYNERYPRPTIHFTVNHTAAGHMFRQGDDATHAIVVRLSDVIAANPDSLDCLYAIDTYLSPMPGEPLVLPAHAVRTISFDTVQGADSESSDERQKARTSRVLDEMKELQVTLTGDPEADVCAFPSGTHYSSDPVDSRLRELASELGVSTGLHQNHATSRYERMDDLSQMRCGSVYKSSFSPEDMAQMSRAARARTMTNGRWSGVTASPVIDPDEISIV